MAYIELNDKLSNRHKHKFTNQREREQNEKKKKLTHSMCVWIPLILLKTENNKKYIYILNYCSHKGYCR